MLIIVAPRTSHGLYSWRCILERARLQPCCKFPKTTYGVARRGAFSRLLPLISKLFSNLFGHANPLCTFVSFVVIEFSIAPV